MTSQTPRVSIKEGLLTGPLDNLDKVHLCGSRCGSCNEMSLGAQEVCPNCGADAILQVELGDEGTLYTYTIVRHRPPGNYQGPKDFKPFGLGLVEVDGVIRIMAPLAPAPEELRIGMPLRFHPYVLRSNESGAEVVGFSYTSERA
jgi:uncharacterized OB-fold protein